MNVLFLSSNFPSAKHSVSHEVVLNALITEMAKTNHIFLATTFVTNKRIGQYKNFYYLGDFTIFLKRKSFFKFNLEFSFKDQEELKKKLKIKKMDNIILFWDTYFDLLKFNKGEKVISYAAKPRFSNSLSELLGRWPTKFNILNLINLLILRKKHYLNYKKFSKNFNICNIDVKKSSKNGMKCNYLNNTWPDFFGKDCIKKRFEKLDQNVIKIIANIGNVNSTGNKIGIDYFIKKILPSLNEYILNKSIEVSIFGKGSLEYKYKLKDLNLIKKKGFINNLDDEVTNSQIYILCNNTGFHYGGYTRVCYIMSSGCVLVADKRLSSSMPELIHNYNCLLSKNEFEMIELIRLLIFNKELRKEIATNARKTYEQLYTPKIVAERLLSNAQE